MNDNDGDSRVGGDLFIKPDRLPGAVRSKPRGKRVGSPSPSPSPDPRRSRAEARKALARMQAAPVASNLSRAGNSDAVYDRPDIIDGIVRGAEPVSIVTTTRKPRSYIPRPVPGVKSSQERREERDWPLDPCPLCGGEAEMEEGGNALYPSYNVVCQKCFCSTQSYGSKYWAAWRWNTRKGMPKSLEMPPPEEDTPPNDYGEDKVGAQPEVEAEAEPDVPDSPVEQCEPSEQPASSEAVTPDFMPVMAALPPAEPQPEKPAKPRRRRARPVDPNQMVFDFMEAPGG